MSESVNIHDRSKEKLPTAILTILYSIVICSFFQKCLMQLLSIVNVLDTWAVALHESAWDTWQSEALIHYFFQFFSFECSLHHFPRISEDKSSEDKFSQKQFCQWHDGVVVIRTANYNPHPIIKSVFLNIPFFPLFGLAVSPLLWDRWRFFSLSFPLFFRVFFFFW